MRKFIMTLVATATLMFAACGGGNKQSGPYAAQIQTIQENKDANQVYDAIATIILNYEKATAEEIVTAHHAFVKFDESFDKSKLDESKIIPFLFSKQTFFY